MARNAKAPRFADWNRNADTTLCAPATPPGPGRRGALRVSGPRAAELFGAVFLSDTPGSEQPDRRGLFEGRFDDGRGTQPCLALWMPGPGSYTGEDVVEFHLPGSPPLLRAAWQRLLDLGAAAAEPGEFTRRAFLNGRLDLTRAEGVLELVHAASEAHRRAGAALLEGGLERRALALRGGLEELRALCEASLDFDETDTGHVATDQLEALASGAAAKLAEALSWETAREPLRGAPRVVLTGAPNAGKSTLFNRLTGGRALVSEEAGTTRDWIAGALVVRGVELELVDAPGLEEGADEPERRAQELAAGRRRGADLLLWVADAAAAGPEPPDPSGLSGPRGLSAAGDAQAPQLLVWNQIDRPGAAPEPPAAWRQRATAGWCGVSAATGRGLPELSEALAEALGLGDGRALGEAAGVARGLSQRHRAALEAAAEALEQARVGLAEEAPLDLVAEALREATDALDGITGRTTPEDLLDHIFARFCLGK